MTTSHHASDPALWSGEGGAYDRVIEPDADGYAGGIVSIDGARWRTRTARITPAKPGAFVAVWRRAADGSTEPYSADEDLEGWLIRVDDGDRAGFFRFPREMLAELGVTRSARHPGKRGFRLYPPWCMNLNATAQRTQRAQASAFVATATTRISWPSSTSSAEPPWARRKASGPR